MVAPSGTQAQGGWWDRENWFSSDSRALDVVVLRGSTAASRVKRRNERFRAVAAPDCFHKLDVS